jgi:hypothetical protein
MKKPVIKFVNMTTSEYYPKWDILLNGHKIGYIETERTSRGVEKTATLFGGLHRFRHDSQEDTRWNILDMLKHGQLSTDPGKMAAIIAANDAEIEAAQVVHTFSHDFRGYSLIVSVRRNGQKNYAIRRTEDNGFLPVLTAYHGASVGVEIQPGTKRARTEDDVEALRQALKDGFLARETFLDIIFELEGGN